MARTTSTTETIREQAATMTISQRIAAVVGAVFALVGLAGFVPGLTQNLDAISWAGNESDAKLLGLFEVSILHNLVHLAYGVLGLAAARALNWARNFLIWGGATYLGLGIYGMVIDRNSEANFVPLNVADNWLHLGLGLGMVCLGLLTSASARANARPAQSSL
jgi:hypothetical protein